VSPVMILGPCVCHNDIAIAVDLALFGEAETAQLCKKQGSVQTTQLTK